MVKEVRDRNGRNTHLGSASSPEYSGCITSLRPEPPVEVKPLGAFRICTADEEFVMNRDRQHLVAVGSMVTLCGEHAVDVTRLDESHWGAHEWRWCRKCDGKLTR